MLGATPKAMQALQEGYDNMTKVCRLGREYCRDLAKLVEEHPGPDPCNTCHDMIVKALAKIREVQQMCDGLDVMMTTPRSQLNDADVKKSLVDANTVFLPLLQMAQDIKVMYKSKKTG